MIGFYNDISKKSIFGSADTAIDLPNGTIIDHMNNNLLPNVGTNSLISTSKTFGFCVAV